MTPDPKDPPTDEEDLDDARTVFEEPDLDDARTVFEEPVSDDARTVFGDPDNIQAPQIEVGNSDLQMTVFAEPDSVTARPTPGIAQAESESLYDVLELLDEGGMGTIHLARDRKLRRRAAFKQMKARVAQDPALVARFLSEAQITAQLDHPNIVPVYSLETRADGRVAYAMKLVEGLTLRQLIDEAMERHTRKQVVGSSYPLNARLDVFLKLCDAVDFAHSRGVIHRDLKPANVMIGGHGEVYLMDWGIARLIGVDEHEGEFVQVALGVDEQQAHADLTMAGQAVGTPAYMSPEQAAGKNQELDGRSDQYALGLLLFELVSLRRANVGTTLKEAYSCALSGEKVRLVHLDERVKIPAELRAIIEKSTRVELSERYSSVHELAEDIRRFLCGESVLARPDSLLQSLGRWIRRNLQTTLAVVMLLMLALSTWAIHSLVGKQQVLDESQERERRITNFQGVVLRRGQEIDSWLLRFEERA